jgi:hypothetical protein
MLQFQDEVMTKHGYTQEIRRNTHGIFSKYETNRVSGSYVLVKYRTGKPPTRAHTF